MFNFNSLLPLSCAAMALAGGPAVMAAQTVVPQSALISSGQYYTDIVGGGIGDVVVMTGGGNAANVGVATGRNDDGFSGPIAFGYTFDFFGTNHTSFYANNNGNISFGSGIAAYVPTGPTGSDSPVVSAWFGDVDTRASLSGVLHLRQDLANQTILTWDGVGYFSARADVLDSFQMVVRGPGYAIPNGEGVIGFFYKTMGWERTDTSVTAAVGFGDGLGNSIVLAGSNVAGLNPVVANHYIWFDQNLVPVPPPVPEPATYALMLAGLGGLGFIARRRKP